MLKNKEEVHISSTTTVWKKNNPMWNMVTVDADLFVW